MEFRIADTFTDIPLQERIETVGDDADLKATPSATCSTSPARGRGITCW